MRFSTVFAAVAALFFSLQSQAVSAQAVSEAAVARAVRECLDNAPMPDDMPSCVGRAAAKCHDQTTDPGNHRRQVTCNLAEASAWDDFLAGQMRERAGYYQKLDADEPVPSGEPTRVESLKASDAAWRAFRDAECRQKAAEYAGNVMSEIVLSGCFMTSTADRALDLYFQTAY
ncbi:MAG: lysozyme inhibitor LprI family protein [Paracoccaceae bacterium]